MFRAEIGFDPGVDYYKLLGIENVAPVTPKIIEDNYKQAQQDVKKRTKFWNRKHKLAELEQSRQILLNKHYSSYYAYCSDNALLLLDVNYECYLEFCKQQEFIKNCSDADYAVLSDKFSKKMQTHLALVEKAERKEAELLNSASIEKKQESAASRQKWHKLKFFLFFIIPLIFFIVPSIIGLYYLIKASVLEKKAAAMQEKYNAARDSSQNNYELSCEQLRANLKIWNAYKKAANEKAKLTALMNDKIYNKGPVASLRNFPPVAPTYSSNTNHRLDEELTQIQDAIGNYLESHYRNTREHSQYEHDLDRLLRNEIQPDELLNIFENFKFKADGSDQELIDHIENYKKLMTDSKYQNHIAEDFTEKSRQEDKKLKEASEYEAKKLVN